VSTPGGWLRVFGRSIGTPAAGHARAAVATLEADIQAAIRTKDFPRAQLLMSNLEQATASVDAAAGTTLRLKPEGSGAPITLQAVAANTTEYHASFLVPASVAAGKYTAQISNGRSSHAKGEWVNLKMFAPAHAPSVLEKNGVDGDGIVRVVTVEAPRVWKDDVFTVDCEWTKPIFERPCGWVGARSSVQVRRSMHQGCLLNPRNLVFYPFFYPFSPIFRPFSASGRQESRKHGQKSRGKREKIGKNRGK